MKLYATVQSERATKGQGGNDYLFIDILNEAQQKVCNVKVYPDSDNGDGMIIFTTPSGKVSRHLFEKGNNQKGEVCHEVHDLLDVGCEMEHE